MEVEHSTPVLLPVGSEIWLPQPEGWDLNLLRINCYRSWGSDEIIQCELEPPWECSAEERMDEIEGDLKAVGWSRFGESSGKEQNPSSGEG